MTIDPSLLLIAATAFTVTVLGLLFNYLKQSVLALALNTVVNTVTLMLLGERLKDAAIAGASLAQLGEFGFILAALGLGAGIIGTVGYQYVLAVTALSWIASPLWIAAVGYLHYLFIGIAAGRI